MAINFGIALGSALKSGVDTYAALSEEEERDLNIRERRERMAREAQARTAASETLGRAGTNTYMPELQARGANADVARTLDQQNAAFGPEVYSEASRATAGALSRRALPQDMQGRAYRESEAVGDYARRLAAIDPEKALATSTQARQIKQLERQEEQQAKFDAASEKLNGDLTLIRGTAESGGLKGMAELAKKNGLNVKFVEGANGTGRINVLGKDGKVVQAFTDVNSAADALSEARLGRFVEESIPTLGSADKVLSALRSQQEIRIAQSREAREVEAQPGKTALNSAQIANLNAETEGKTLAAKEKKEYNELKTKILNLLKNPSPENQAELSQLARRAGILNPKEVLVVKPLYNPATEKIESVTVNVFTGEVQKSMTEGGVPNARDWAAAQQGKRPDGTTLKPEDITRWNAAHGPEYQISTGGPARSSAIPAQSSAAQSSAASAITRTGRGVTIPAGDRIPPPPREVLIKGTNRRPNPAYAEWEQKFGERYRAQQR